MISVFMLEFCPQMVKAILGKRPADSDQAEQNRILTALIPIFIDQITRPSNAFTAQCRRIIADSDAPFYYSKTPPSAHYLSNVKEFLKTDALPRVTTFFSENDMDFTDFMSLTNLFARIESNCDPDLLKNFGAAALGRLRAFLGKTDDNFIRTIAHGQVAQLVADFRTILKNQDADESEFEFAVRLVRCPFLPKQLAGLQMLRG
jgi:hypothetical protein